MSFDLNTWEWGVITERFLPFLCMLLLGIYSQIIYRRNSRWKTVLILNLCFVAAGGAALVWLPVLLYPLLLIMAVCLLLCFARWEESLGISNVLQCAVVLMLGTAGWILKSEGFSSVVLTLLFVTLRFRENEVLKRFESYSAMYQNRLLQNQVEEVQHMYVTMRGWRHDYHSHLQSLKAKLSKQQVQEAVAYIGELDQSLRDIHLMVESGNVNVDAVLNSKLSLAAEQGIDVNLKVSIPPVLPLSDVDCCVLLGNLIDNAIEACEKVTDRKYVRLYLGVYKKQFYISITNATCELVRKFDEEYITTKRGNHGHGLKRINMVVEKYGGFVNRKNEPGVFVCEIMIPMREKEDSVPCKID